MATRARRARRWIAVSGAVVLAAATSGCLMSPRTAHTVGHLAAGALWTAAIVGQVALLTYHDDHHHHEHCGHYRRWHRERWVYYYGGHWEYYESSSGSWYVYSS